MSDKSNEVVPYFKKNKIKTKSEESLISVFEYYNSLFWKIDQLLVDIISPAPNNSRL